MDIGILNNVPDSMVLPDYKVKETFSSIDAFECANVADINYCICCPNS